MKKKGQLKIQQMAFMLMAITLFFVLAGMFVLTIYVANLRGSADLIENRNALLLVTKLANSPEFSCGESFGTGKSNCVDSDKLMALKQNSDSYVGFWSVENIQVRKVYPASSEIECTQSNYPNCNVIKIRDGEIGGSHSNYVSLCRKESSDTGFYDKCEIGILTVAYD